MIITDITSEKKEKQIQRLAAYCRVSSDSEDQLHSFAAQVCYYANYEKQHPNVELVGIYADEGLSGTSLKNRTELQRLIQDCEHGKVDRVITKSVSRFARNTHDLLQTVRLLKSLGVTVLFEEQGIDTAKLNSEMFLTFPGMIAQQESESISGNMRWSYKKRMESGEFNTCKPAFGFELVNGELVVNKEEAKVIRRIFNYYLQGLGKQRIAELLNNEGVPTKYGDKKWYHTAIHYVLNLIAITDKYFFRTICDIFNNIISNPQLLQPDNDKRTELISTIRLENELKRMLERNKSNKDEIRSKILEAVSAKYDNLHNQKYETLRLRGILLNQQQFTEFPLELFNRTVSNISFDKNNNVIITLINGKTIGKEITNGETEEKSENNRTDNNCQRGRQK